MKTSIGVTLKTEPLYTYMHVKTINDKGGHELERDQGGVYRKVWREKRK